MATTVGLALQLLQQPDDSVLVAARVAEFRVSPEWVRPRDVQAVFQDLRVPIPGDVNRALQRLKATGLVVPRAGKSQGWAVTPLGAQKVSELVADADLEQAQPATEAVGPTLSQATHTVIPPEFAPAEWQPAIVRLLDRYPFDSNVFCMTRFPRDTREDDLPDPVKEVIETARTVLSESGLVLHLASDRAAHDQLFGNVAAHMWACRYGIALFETRFGSQLNDNVQIEVGGMLVTGRRCALLRDRDTPDLPTDFVGQIYKRVDFDDLDAVAATVRAWARDDLALESTPGAGSG